MIKANDLVWGKTASTNMIYMRYRGAPVINLLSDGRFLHRADYNGEVIRDTWDTTQFEFNSEELKRYAEMVWRLHQ